ncbi:hypothetical protein E7744_06695 [Citricoccus sp. SGAir0253]|uniref:hypothetical protein n=1 Tax=Citricoccus sp. SGAir0253 TaxID=2567881 RepID=UPI0010CD48FD|nr:hypothetical protein [Citricoccus sp. SGAir0253]QCU77909.1 hypothetical protein E7744_06695 [Citricoccus sp. SGAir0253]
MPDPVRSPAPGPRGPGAGRPPTWAGTLPVVVAAFATHMVVDLATDWPALVRWGLALGAGLVAGAIGVSAWTAAQRRRGDAADRGR